MAQPTPHPTPQRLKYNGLTREMINFPSEEDIANTVLDFKINFVDDDSQIRHWTKEEAVNFCASSSMLTTELVKNGYAKIQLEDAFVDPSEFFQKWTSTVNVYDPPPFSNSGATKTKPKSQPKSNQISSTTVGYSEGERRSVRIQARQIEAQSHTQTDVNGGEMNTTNLNIRRATAEAEKQKPEKADDQFAAPDSETTTSTTQTATKAAEKDKPTKKQTFAKSKYSEDPPDPDNCSGLPKCFVWLNLITKVGHGIYTHTRVEPREAIKRLPVLENITVGELAFFYDEVFKSNLDTPEGQREAVTRYYKVLKSLPLKGDELMIPYILSFNEVSDTIVDHTAVHGLNFKCPNPEDAMFQQLSTVVGEGENQYRVGNNDGNTNPMLFWGFAGSSFSIHIEDFIGINAMNLLLFGPPKVWMFVSKFYCHTLRESIRDFYKKEKLPGFDQEGKYVCAVQHKMTIVDGSFLDAHGIPHQLIIQRKAQLVITGACAHHCGFNLGCNLAIAVSCILGDFHRAASVLHSQCDKHDKKDPHRQHIIPWPDLIKWAEYSAKMDEDGIDLHVAEQVKLAIDAYKAAPGNTTFSDQGTSTEVDMLDESSALDRIQISNIKSLVPSPFVSGDIEEGAASHESMSVDAYDQNNRPEGPASLPITDIKGNSGEHLILTGSSFIKQDFNQAEGIPELNCHSNSELLLTNYKNEGQSSIYVEEQDASLGFITGDLQDTYNQSYDRETLTVRREPTTTEDDTDTTIYRGTYTSSINVVSGNPLTNETGFFSAASGEQSSSMSSTVGASFLLPELGTLAVPTANNKAAIAKKRKERTRTTFERLKKTAAVIHTCHHNGCGKEFVYFRDYKKHINNKSCRPPKKCLYCKHRPFKCYVSYRAHRIICRGCPRDNESSSDEFDFSDC